MRTESAEAIYRGDRGKSALPTVKHKGTQGESARSIRIAEPPTYRCGAVRSFGVLVMKPSQIFQHLRAWYRTVDYLKASPDEAVPIIFDWIDNKSGAGFTVEDAERFLTDLVLFSTYDEIAETCFYNEESPFYWETRLQFVVDYFGEAEGLDTDAIDLGVLVPAPGIFPNVAP